MMEQSDRIVQGMAWGGDFRIIAAETTQAVESARIRSDLSPVSAAALGRVMTGALLLTRLLDKDVRRQWVTLRFDGNGPLGIVLAEATVAGNVRGYVANPQHDDPRVDVGAAIGSKGTLSVVRGSPPAGKPYTSQVSLVSGEVAKDIAHYLATSEQIASAVMLGVLTRPAGVEAAGGLVVQAFPHASESAIESMEKTLEDAPSLSTLLDRMTIDEAVQELLRGTDFKMIDPSFDIPVRYSCSCTRERALSQFRFLPRQELSEIIAEERPQEVVCQFCGAKYLFESDELLALSDGSDA